MGKRPSGAPADGGSDREREPVPERSAEEALAGLTWAGGRRSGGALRFFERDGTSVTPEEIAAREPPRDAPEMADLTFADGARAGR